MEPEIMTSVPIAWHTVVMRPRLLQMFSPTFKSSNVAIKGPKTEGAMAEEIDISNSRDPDFFHDTHVSEMMKKLHATKA